MSVSWQEEDAPVARAAHDDDDLDGSLRCLVCWILPSALLGAIGFFAGLAWLAARIGG